MDKREFLELIKKEDFNTPVFSKLAIRLLRLCQKPNVTFRHLSSLLKQDAGTTTTILKIANSAAYGPTTVPSIEKALLRLGLEKTIQVCLLAAEKQRFESKNKELKEIFHDLWLHNFLVSSTAQWASERLEISQPKIAFLAGMLHDFGKLYMLSAAQNLANENKEYPENLEEIMDQHHEEIGEYALKRKNLPKAFCYIAGHHHKEEYSPTELLLIIRIADAVARDEDPVAEIAELGVSIELLEEIKMKISEMKRVKF